MTTAHRPTYHPAKGRADEGGNRYLQPTVMASAKDLPSHKLLKTRQPGQGTKDEVKQKDLKAELLERERKALGDKAKPESSDTSSVTDDVKQIESAKSEQPNFSKLDADEELPSSSEEENDDDDEAELMRELERIKRERAEEAARKAEEERRAQEAMKHEEIIRANPLLNLNEGQEDHTIKRRWDDDVVFKNTCKSEPIKKKRFINDTIRNDFHKKFLQKYVQ
eukprot:c6653_g1_i1.p1 GENE.c6653_g1_i1~~c6653_g1_i1.p1  ORF type:complete len:223 (+),score=66.13 c6653_g1_i1:44-712(+)